MEKPSALSDFRMIAGWLFLFIEQSPMPREHLFRVLETLLLEYGGKNGSI
jgi:hypothetical protein